MRCTTLCRCRYRFLNVSRPSRRKETEKGNGNARKQSTVSGSFENLGFYCSNIVKCLPIWRLIFPAAAASPTHSRHPSNIPSVIRGRRRRGLSVFPRRMELALGGSSVSLPSFQVLWNSRVITAAAKRRDRSKTKSIRLDNAKLQ